MNINNAIKSAAREELGTLITRLPVEAIKLLIQLVAGALQSDDPTRYIERRATADASAIASEAAIATTLKAGAKKKDA